MIVWLSSVPAMANSMPTAACCMPRRALSGRVRLRSPENEQDRRNEVTAFDEVSRMAGSGKREG